MYESFEAISFLKEILESRQNGRVHITSENVEWCLDVTDGKLVFAAHSLQYINAVETTLPSLGYETLLPIYWQLLKLKVYRRQGDHRSLESLNWTSKIVGAFVHYNLIEVEQAGEILAKLSQDAVEALLGLESATVVWSPFPDKLWHATVQGTDIAPLTHQLSDRLKIWQSISDRICSPHQRPYCESVDDLHKAVPQGGLSKQMLESLVRLMQGASIRQLAQTIKQDEAKLAQLLYPYVVQQTIKLWPPLPPLDRLPWLPTKQQQPPELMPATVGDSETPVVVNSFEPVPAAVGNGAVQKSEVTANTWSLNKDSSDSNNLKNSAFAINGSGRVRPRHLIICIDDSQAMLEKIESYLDPNHFELQTIIDPVKAISKICTRKPSLVLMDISMPSISGNSLCSILKRSYMFKDVPIIMISSNTGALNKAKSEVSGAAGYLEKPFSKSQLMDVLDSHLNLKINGIE